MSPQTVIDFWFSELTPKDWFTKSDTLDNTIKQRFGDTLKAAAQGECWRWRDTPDASPRLLCWISFHVIFFVIRREHLGRLAMALVWSQRTRSLTLDFAMIC